MGNKKRIGILTSGGDCAGLNAAIRAVTQCAIGIYGWEVLGICKATQGLMSCPPQTMHLYMNKVEPILMMGGTILGTTNKGDPFAFPMPDGTVLDRSQEIIDGYHQLKLDA
ncbi:MAG: 6-phosphofructokinase, partial [Xenococcaceae cyanobacterium]